MKIIVSFVLFGLLMAGQPAVALDLKNAKAQGLIGETKTGYLAPVKSSSQVQQLVTSINAKRKAHYQKISKRNKTALSAVEQLAGKKAMSKTPAGQYVKMNGAWKKK